VCLRPYIYHATSATTTTLNPYSLPNEVQLMMMMIIQRASSQGANFGATSHSPICLSLPTTHALDLRYILCRHAQMQLIRTSMI
jgi:predicted ATPase